MTPDRKVLLSIFFTSLRRNELNLFNYAKNNPPPSRLEGSSCYPQLLTKMKKSLENRFKNDTIKSIK